jgi:type II secretory pathway pseudopilin PulG
MDFNTAHTAGTSARGRLASHAFTLPEVLLAVAFMSILVLANLSAISYSRFQTVKDRERGIVLDFVGHYLELVKALPFTQASPGLPVNALYDGTGGAPNIRIPVTSGWFGIGTGDFQTFHPNLVWLAPRNPRMHVELTTSQVGGVEHTKHILVEVQWDSPTGIGPAQSVSMDMIRTKDL